MKINVLISLFIVFLFTINSPAQHLNTLIPTNTATHTAVMSGSWFNPLTWNTGTIPGDAAIVVIPNGITVNYEGKTDAHIFAIRVDGVFNCAQTSSSDTTKLTFDTFIGTHLSYVKFLANNATDGQIDVRIKPFDIEAHKGGTSGFSQVWNTNALNHYSDGAPVFEVRKEVTGGNRYDTYADALLGGNAVNEISRVSYNDGVGVTGRYGWDSTQLSLGIITMGQLEIIGQAKTTMVKLNADANRNQNLVQLESSPSGWNVGDSILITLDGNASTSARGNDVAVIASIVGNQITTANNLDKNHKGRPADNLHCYVGNLTRNIKFSSADISNIHRRGHLMAMHNSTNIQIRNASFKKMGRTDKRKLLDDFIWKQWLQPRVFVSKISALGQEICEMQRNPKADITNSRGRYSLHLHKTGARLGDSMTYITGNVVEDNPGWAITQHDSYATISDNVVYGVTGAGIVSESGSELGFWDNNLVVAISKGHSTDVYDAALFHDEYLFSGEALAMKGRGVVCRNNVIANSFRAVGVVNLNPSISNHDRVDPDLLAIARPGFAVDQFPLDRNGYSIEGDGVMPVEVALIMENTTCIWSNQALRSIERDMGVNHESRSVFDGFISWGANQGLSIVYQADYSFKDVFLSGKNANSIGVFMWKHSHNHVFENIKMTDMGYPIQVSKLVGSSVANLKTRNNGQTPWIFIDLQLGNYLDLYKLEKDNPTYPLPYTEHPDNTIHLSSSEVTARPTTFTILDSSEMVVDVGAGDFQFKVDGIITDDLGSYRMGIRQAEAQGNLRLDYPERIYEFASQVKFEEYLSNHGVYKDTTDNNQLYFIINEFLPNRRTYQYTSFPVRIKIMNAPSTGVYASPQIESALYTENPYRLISRMATVSQSSTNDTTYYYNTTNLTYNIGCYPEKAIDGNVNGRINCQIQQQGLLPVGSFSQTNIENEAWFDLDLGSLKEIEFIDIWNTVELNGSDMETNSTHFSNFYVLISDIPFDSVDLATARIIADYEYFETSASTTKLKTSLNNLNAIGRYVRIQAQGINKIKLAEVEIIGRDFVLNSPLPIELLSFEATPHPDGKIESLLNWITASEKNVTHFEVQHASDEVQFHKIGQVEVYPNSTTTNTYQWLHQTPMMGNNYYRLKMINIDGSFEFSPVSVVKFDSNNQGLVVYPNPTKEEINLELYGNQIRGVAVYNIAGKQVLSRHNIQASIVSIPVSSLPSGVYILQVIDGTGVVINRKLIVE